MMIRTIGVIKNEVGKRPFSGCGYQSGVIKAKLERFRSSEKVMILNKKEQMQKQDKLQRKRQQAAMQPYSAQKYNHLVKKISPTENIDVDQDVTPKSLTVLQKSDRRMMYNYLKMNGYDIQDSYKVALQVLNLLCKDHDTKALLLCKMAGKSGVVGMNHILATHLSKGNFTMALKIMTRRKKWGVPCNEQTYTILLAGFAKARKLLTRKQVDRLYEIYKSLEKQYRGNRVETKTGKDAVVLSNTHINSVLSALTYTQEENQEHAWEIFNSLPASGPHSANSITFTVMFNGLRNVQNPEVYRQQLEKLVNLLLTKIDYSHNHSGNGMKFKIDLKLLTALSNAASRCTSVDLRSLAFHLIDKYVDLEKYSLRIIFSDLKPCPSNVESIPSTKKSAKLLPDTQLLTSLVLLASASPQPDKAFYRLISVDPGNLDFVFLKRWISIKFTQVKVTTQGDVIYQELQKVRNVLLNSVPQTLIHDIFSHENYFLKQLYKAYGSQIFHVNNQIYNDKKLEKLDPVTMEKLKSNKAKENYRLFTVLQKIHASTLLKSSDKNDELRIFHSFLRCFFHLELSTSEHIQILKYCVDFFKSFDLFKFNESPSEVDLFVLKGILLHTITYIKKLLSELPVDKSTKPLRLSLMQLKSYCLDAAHFSTPIETEETRQ